jgi:hypothetical protein
MLIALPNLMSIDYDIDAMYNIPTIHIAAMAPDLPKLVRFHHIAL